MNQASPLENNHCNSSNTMAIILSAITILMSIVTLILFVRSQVATTKVPPSVPWAGLRRGVFSKTRACIRELTAGLRTLKIGYDQVCQVLTLTLTLMTVSGVVQSKGCALCDPRSRVSPCRYATSRAPIMGVQSARRLVLRYQHRGSCCPSFLCP